MHARLTYDFKQDSDEERVFYEAGTEDAAALVSGRLQKLIDRIETAQFMSFKNPSKIKVYIFNDKKRYGRFSYNVGTQTLGNATKNGYLSHYQQFEQDLRVISARKKSALKQLRVFCTTNFRTSI